MDFFIPCSTAFEDAVRDKLSDRYWKVLIDIDDDDVVEDVTANISNNDISGSGRLEGSSNEAVSNTYKVVLRNPGGIYSEGDFAFAKCEIQVAVGTAEYITLFTGFVSEEGCARSINALSEDVITITMFDKSKHIAMNRNTTEAVYVNFKISDKTSPSTSIFHKLADQLGLDPADLDLENSIDITKPYLQLSGSDKVWSEMQSLAAQYLGKLTFRYDGLLRLSSRFETGYTDPTSEWTFSEELGNIHNLKMRGGKITSNRVKTEFDVHTVLSQRQIYRNVQGYNVVTGKCSITVLPGEYWPGGTKDTDVAELKYLEPSTGEEYPIAINVQTPTIGVSGSGSDIESDGGVMTLESFNGTAGTNPGKTEQLPSSSQIILKNATGSTVTITKLDLRGQPIRVDQKVIVEDVDATITNDWEYRDKQIDGKYAVSRDQATVTTQWWMNYGKVRRTTIEMETDWLPQVQEGALVTLIAPTYGLNMVCEIIGWNHPAAKGSLRKQKTKLILREWMSFTPAVDPSSVSYQGQGLATSEGIDDTAQEIAARAKYIELQEGYTAGGGVEIPTVPVISVIEGHFKGITLEWDKQLNLTNFDRYEIQVSDDDSTWYSLEQDLTDWKDTLSADTDVFFERMVHNVPFAGTTEIPLAKTLYYQVRRVTKEPVASAWSTSASATTLLVDNGDLTANNISVGKLVASEINTIFLQATAAVIVGYYTGGTGTNESPEEGDRRAVIEEDEMRLEEWTAGVWSTVRGVLIGGIVAGLFLSGIGCNNAYHPENPPTNIEYFPNNNYRVFNFENNHQDQYSTDDWNTKTNVAYSTTQKKYGAYSLFAAASSVSDSRFTSGGITGQDQSIGFWAYLDTLTAANAQMLQYYYEPGSSTNQLYITATNTGIYFGTYKGSFDNEQYFFSGDYSGGWHYFGISWKESENKLYCVLDNEIQTVTNTDTWDSGTFEFRLRAYNTSIKIYIDEVVYSPNQFINPDIWVQHYNHNTAWNIDFSIADIILRCNTGGRVRFDTQQNEKSIGTAHLLSLADIPSSWVLNAGAAITFTSVSFAPYVPVGVTALIVQIITTKGVSNTGNVTYLASIDEVSPPASTKTEYNRVAGPAGNDLSNGQQAIISCSIYGEIQYRNGNSGGLTYLNIRGYYI